MLKSWVVSLGAQTRERRARVFRQRFTLDETTKILDLGGFDGSNMFGVIRGTSALPRNVYIADPCHEAVEDAERRYGFRAVRLSGSGPLPFPDKFFDIVFCSSVIEHVTGPRDDIWIIWKDRDFISRAKPRQQQFAREIARVGKHYFVQTPHPSFPIESHSWFPFLNRIPRPYLAAVMAFINCFWVKKVEPDWNLLNPSELQQMFPDSEVVIEKFAGFPKSIMAVKASCGPPHSHKSYTTLRHL